MSVMWAVIALGIGMLVLVLIIWLMAPREQ